LMGSHEAHFPVESKARHWTKAWASAVQNVIFMDMLRVVRFVFCQKELVGWSGQSHLLYFNFNSLPGR
jgi:hypothetical protein